MEQRKGKEMERYDLGREIYDLSALDAAVEYDRDTNQFTAFASELGWGPGYAPDLINLRSPRTGRVITFVLEKRGLMANNNYWHYIPSMKTPARFSHLSFVVFND